jgi:hypothetical protein
MSAGVGIEEHLRIRVRTARAEYAAAVKAGDTANLGKTSREVEDAEGALIRFLEKRDAQAEDKHTAPKPRRPDDHGAAIHEVAFKEAKPEAKEQVRPANRPLPKSA